MDLNRVLEELRRELEHLDAAIHSLEQMQRKTLRRGRPPKILSELRRPSRETLRRTNSGRRTIGRQPQG
jgi:hypothetical protein